MRPLREQTEYYARAQYVAAGATIALVLAFYVFGYARFTGRERDLQDQIAAKRRELDENQVHARNLPQVARDVETLRARLADFKTLPATPELGAFMRDITRASQEASLKGLLVRPEVPRRGEKFCVLPITLSFEGDFLNVDSFLRHAEDLPRLTRVTGLTVRSADPGSGRVQVTVLMDLYFSEG